MIIKTLCSEEALQEALGGDSQLPGELEKVFGGNVNKLGCLRNKNNHAFRNTYTPVYIHLGKTLGYSSLSPQFHDERSFWDQDFRAGACYMMMQL